MPTKVARRHYNLVDDSYDTRVPLHNEDAFQHGIRFKAKYIGSLDVQRPSARTEIVVAMRNIRYEFKAKQIKKRKVNVSVSIDGVRINLRKKKKKKNKWVWDEENAILMHDPVYRIFYVSHDSHDLKIWSYIARDGSSNRFRCNVFKSNRKKQAMHIVRTIGQAFEVCHKFNPQPSASNVQKKTESSTKDNSNLDDKKKLAEETDIDAVDDVEGGSETVRKGVTDLDSAKKASHVTENLLETPSAHRETIPGHMINSSQFELQLMRQKVAHAEQQAQMTSARIKHMKEKLKVENAARVETQARNHQLLVQNRELISHMVKLVAHLKMVEQLGNPKSLALDERDSSPLIIKAQSLLSSQISSSLHSNMMLEDAPIENGSLLKISALSLHETAVLSVVENPNKSRRGRCLWERGGGDRVDTGVPAITESSEDSSSTSSSDSSNSPQVLIADCPSTSSPLSDTIDTSVWTGLDSLSTLHQSAVDTSFHDVTTSVSLSNQSAHNTTNRYSISPIPYLKEPSPRNKSVGPIVWKSLPPSTAANTASIPRIDPPPRVDRANSSSNASRPRRDPPFSPLSPNANKFSDVSPAHDECHSSPLSQGRSSYEPRHEVNQSSHLRKNGALLAGKPSCILSTSFNDDIETTVGSILDEAAASPDQFSSDFWEGDFKTADSSSEPASTCFKFFDHTHSVPR